MPDIWLQNGNPWEIQRAGIQYRVGFYGSVDQHKWTPGEQVSCGVGCLTQGKARGLGLLQVQTWCGLWLQAAAVRH